TVIPKDDFDVLYLPGGKIDTRVSVQSQFPGRPLAGPYVEGERGLYLVQFVGPIKSTWLSDLRATGAVPIQHVAYNGFIVAAHSDQAAAIGQHSRVQFLNRLHPFLKPALSTPAGTRASVYVQIANVPDAETIVEELQLRSSTPLGIHRATDEILVTATLDGTDIAAVLTHPLIFGV